VLIATTYRLCGNHNIGATTSDSMSSASSKASSAASSVSSSLSKAMPSATAAATGTTQSQTSTQTIVVTTIVLTATTILLVLAGIYYSGYADDILEAMAKKYYSAKAQAEAMALANTGSEKVQGVLKGEITRSRNCCFIGPCYITVQTFHTWAE
jgi:hypothetical protein